jgi:DNA gyrase subunit A
MAVEDLRVVGRATQGVRLINIKGTDSIAAVTKVMKDDPEVALEEAIEEAVEDGRPLETTTETSDIEILEAGTTLESDTTEEETEDN